MDNILKMLRINNAPTVPSGEEEVAADVDEPPDDKVPELSNPFKKEIHYKSTAAPSLVRRESLLTRAIQAEHEPSPLSAHMQFIPRGLSTTSSHSFASTAELTSDAESPLRSATPSPPPPLDRFQMSPATKPTEDGKVIIAAPCKDDRPATGETGEAAIEKTLGRKRCIMFACGDVPTEPPKEVRVVPKVEQESKIDAAPRKPRISFACPMKPVSNDRVEQMKNELPRRQSSPPPFSRRSVDTTEAQPRRATEANTATYCTTKPEAKLAPLSRSSSEEVSAQAFHEFASSQDEHDEWVKRNTELTRPKLTIDDCLRKENAIRKLGKEAEEEAEEEEREKDEIENELVDDDEDIEDDFAPSDNDSDTDEGNESDDEEGFAESDDESDAGSEYRFWAPSTTTTRATSIDNMTHFSTQSKGRSRTSSLSSHSSNEADTRRRASKLKASRALKMRPGTPELPDSTDFVCGTLDEDRPLEAAYLSCREQRRKERQVPIPQDIDPSFPTTDPEDNDDEEQDDEVAESSDHAWMHGQFEDFDDDVRGRRASAFKVSPLENPAPMIAPPRPVRPVAAPRTVHRSPPPKHHIVRSPAPRGLFDHASKRLRSPAPARRLRSPRGSPTNAKPTPFGITINHLAQRPNAEKTASLPHTPNPFFRNWKNGQQPISRVTSTTVTSGTESPNPDLHVRGPVDIVIGLEKKRQKRKEKYWRQNCRKAAREQAAKRPPPGRGVERMKELGLECAERTKGYGLGQPAQLVLSL